MKKHLQKITLIVLLLLAFQISSIKLWGQSNPTTTGPIGSQLAYGVNEDIKYWNGTIWVAIPSGLPGQSLTFPNGVPTWVNNPNGITTNAVSNITATTAICGGQIASSSGSPITARGVCWSTNHNPTIADNHTNDDTGKGNYISNITNLLWGVYYIRAYATNSVGTAYGNEISLNLAIVTPSNNVTDYDGNIYNTIIIGEQTWMKQNLKVKHYNNGDSLPNADDYMKWQNSTSGAYCNYGNYAINNTTYGSLYNMYAVIDPRNLCPTGWKVPSKNDWDALITYLGGDTLASGRLYTDITPAGSTNQSGFTALPGGFTYSSQIFSDINYVASFWTSTNCYSAYTWDLWFTFNTKIIRQCVNYKYGNSVRCIKDSLYIGKPYLGGIIAYILQPGDPGYNTNVPHGLIAAPSDQGSAIQWFNGSFITSGATATALGTGNANTNLIVASQGTTGGSAAKMCFDLVLNGYSDWYLPSKDELSKLYINKAAIGGFYNAGYWSSSEDNNTLAWMQYFNNGNQHNYSKSFGFEVRAVRSF